MIWETGSLTVGSRTEAGRGFGVAAGCPTDWDWEGLGLLLALGLVVVDWVGACGGGPEVGGMDDGVALVVGLVVGAAVAPLPPGMSWEGKQWVQAGLLLVGWEWHHEEGKRQFQFGPGVWFVGGFL